VGEKWNTYICSKYNTLDTYTTSNYTKLHKTTLNEKELELFNKIDEINLDGRNLELYFPLIMTASNINDEILIDILRIAKSKTFEKKDMEMLESKDIAMIDFVAKKIPSLAFVSINDLKNEFKQFFESGDDDLEWLTSNWMGRAIMRLNLALKKRRLGRGIEVILNVGKAKDKIKIFTNKEVQQ
jgi:hypothetical protein